MRGQLDGTSVTATLKWLNLYPKGTISYDSQIKVNTRKHGNMSS